MEHYFPNCESEDGYNENNYTSFVTLDPHTGAVAPLPTTAVCVCVRCSAAAAMLIGPMRICKLIKGRKLSLYANGSVDVGASCTWPSFTALSLILSQRVLSCPLFSSHNFPLSLFSFVLEVSHLPMHDLSCLSCFSSFLSFVLLFTPFLRFSSHLLSPADRIAGLGW